MDHPLISADGHIDFPLLPETLWIDNAPAELRDRMPRVVESSGTRIRQGLRAPFISKRTFSPWLATVRTSSRYLALKPTRSSSP